MQFAFGGHSLNTGVNSFLDAPIHYFEPGLNTSFPVSIASPKADSIYILTRLRLDAAGTVFGNYSVTSLKVTARDTTRGRLLNNSVFNGGELHNKWTQDGLDPVVIKIDVAQFGSNEVDQIGRVRSIDVKIAASVSDFVLFRMNVEDDGRDYSFLTVYNNNIQDRPNVARRAKTISHILREGGSYILISPHVTFQETHKEVSHFSYPPDRIFYFRDNTFARETYDFSIGETSHDFITDSVSVIPVPNYHHVGVLLIDGFLKKASSGISGAIYVDINAVSRESGNTDTFRVYFARQEIFNFEE